MSHGYSIERGSESNYHEGNIPMSHSYGPIPGKSSYLTRTFSLQDHHMGLGMGLTLGFSVGQDCLVWSNWKQTLHCSFLFFWNPKSHRVPPGVLSPSKQKFEPGFVIFRQFHPRNMCMKPKKCFFGSPKSPRVSPGLPKSLQPKIWTRIRLFQAISP
jgi:hypothetical protein